MITNRDRFPDVKFLPQSEWRVIGNVEGTPLALIGIEEGTGDRVVARCPSGNPQDGDLHAVPLGELTAHTYGAIAIDDD